jgi:hypothetical protein
LLLPLFSYIDLFYLIKYKAFQDKSGEHSFLGSLIIIFLL